MKSTIYQQLLVFKGEVNVTAEICYSCWNRIKGKYDPPKKYKMSRDIELCEECGRWTQVIISERKSYDFHKFRMF